MYIHYILINTYIITDVTGNWNGYYINYSVNIKKKKENETNKKQVAPRDIMQVFLKFIKQ